MSIIISYVESMAVYMIVAIPFYLIGRITFIKKKRKPINIWHEVVLATFALYIIGLASQTIIPQWNFGMISETGKLYFDINLSNNIATVNLIPFKTLFQYLFQSNANVDNWASMSFVNISGNILLFSPIGFFVPLFWDNWRSFRKILLLGLAVTLFIEIFQLFIGRSTDIDDVILNTIGVIIGYGIFSLLKNHMRFNA